jgi:transposase-like protein
MAPTILIGSDFPVIQKESSLMSLAPPPLGVCRSLCRIETVDGLSCGAWRGSKQNWPPSIFWVCKPTSGAPTPQMTSPMKDAAVLPLAQSAPEDALRARLQQLIHETLEREFAQFLGAARVERSADRRGVRNGYRHRCLLTRVGSLELRVPRDRAGHFQPSLFARYQRSEQALVLALIEMYLQGVSTRKVSAGVEQLCGATISASDVAAQAKTLDASLAAWRSRGLGAQAYPYLVVDAHVERVRREGQVRGTAALWVIGVGADGYREHLGVWLGASESGASWRRVFEALVKRGLTGVAYVVSDEHAGLVDAIRRYFPDAAHQRCQVHFLRNARDHVSSHDLQQRVKDGLRNAWPAERVDGGDTGRGRGPPRPARHRAAAPARAARRLA